MTRWQLEVWLNEKPDIKHKKFWQTNCRLCAISQCMDLAQDVEAAWRDRGYTVSWTVSKLTGVVDGWDIAYTSSMPKLARVKRHAHR